MVSTKKEKVIDGKKLILRKGYKKRSHKRRAYVRRDGIKVKAVQVKSTHVKPGWIVKKGITTGKYGLIPLFDKRHLATFGYKFDQSSVIRHQALEKAVNKFGRNWTVRRLTALANVRPNLPKYSKIVSTARRDVAFIQKNHPSKSSR